MLTLTGFKREIQKNLPPKPSKNISSSVISVVHHTLSWASLLPPPPLPQGLLLMSDNDI